MTPELLLQAYAMGIFPMADSRDSPEIHWIDPLRRGVFPLDRFHVSRSLRRQIAREPFRISFDTDFGAIVGGCAARSETWINDEIFALYDLLHRDGFAHSAEVWEGELLVGGVYGVVIGAAFFGESMFSRRTGASKIALTYLIDRLRTGGFTLFDTQFLTDHLASLGATEVSRSAYHKMLKSAVSAEARFDTGPVQSADQILQRMTQTS